MSAPHELIPTAMPDLPAGFELTEEPLEPSGMILTVAGELDIATAPTLRARLSAAIESGARRVIIDLTPVAFLDSISIAVILHARAQLADGGRIAVVIPSGSYTRLVFEVAGLPRCLDMFDTRSDAVAHVAR